MPVEVEILCSMHFVNFRQYNYNTEIEFFMQSIQPSNRPQSSPNYIRMPKCQA